MIELLKGKVTPRDWLIVGLVLAFTAVLCALFYFVLYQPRETQIAKLESQLAEIDKNLARAREIEANIEQLETEAKKWAELVQIFEERLPEEREIPKLLRKFENDGARIGLRLQISTLDRIRDVNKETLPYEISCTGNFHQIVTFVNMFERDERYFKISDLDIQEQEAGVSTATFTLNTFRFLRTERKDAQ